MVRRPSRTAVALGAVAALATGLLVASLGPAAPARAADPTSDAQNAVSYAAARGYRSAVTVVDTENGTIWGAGDIDAQYVTESLVKLFIATRLLVQGQMTGYNASTAYLMITQSDDASANALYGRVGGDGILPWTAAHYGITNLGAPPPSPGYWGATRITARGLAQFYAAVRWDPVVWPWLSNAMHHATPYGSDGFYQFFGIPSATTGFGVKQGWGSDTPTGVPEQNSTGTVDGDRFAVVILTQGPGYGGALSSMLTSEAQRILPGGWVNANRFGLVAADGTALGKDGNPLSAWVAETSGITQVAVTPTRYAVVDRTGLLRVKEGSLYGTWVDVATDVASVVLAGNRIVVVDTQGNLWVKEGTLQANWVLLAGGVTAAVADGTRIGAVGRDGVLRVKDGIVQASWVAVAGDVTEASLAATRIGVVTTAGLAQVKEGALTATWVAERTDATDVQVTRGRVAVTTRDRQLVVKEGTLFDAWLTVATGVRSAVVKDNRIATFAPDGSVQVKEGTLTAQWYGFYTSATALAFG